MSLGKNLFVASLVALCLTTALFMIFPTRSSNLGYDPWADVSGPTPGIPDGVINMRDINYEILHFNTFGTPIDRSKMIPIEFDSGWIDITDKCGQYFNVTHNLNSTDFLVGIGGKTTLNGAAHQRDYGLKEIAQGWNKTFSGPYPGEAYALVKTSDGGYAFAGTTSTYASEEDFWLVKTDAEGNVQWNQSYGGPNSEIAYALVQTSDGGYALAGSTAYSTGWDQVYYDAWFVKTDGAGNMQWNQTYVRTGNDMIHALAQTTDGGYALAGSGFWLIKTDAVGNVQWNQTYGGAGAVDAYALVQTGDGGYTLAGRTGSFGAGSYDFWLVKTNSEGNMLWNQTYGGAGWDEACALVKTSDGGYALAGSTAASGTANFYFWLVKTDASGNMQWNQTYVNAATGGEACSLVQTMDGGYAMAGWTSGPGLFDFGFVKTDENGNVQLYEEYGGTNVDMASALVQAADGGYVLAGWTNSFGAGGHNAWLVKIGVESGLVWVKSTVNTITLYRGLTDNYWNYVRVYIWKAA